MEAQSNLPKLSQHVSDVAWIGNLALEPSFCPQYNGAKGMNTKICFQGHLEMAALICLPPAVTRVPLSHSHSATQLKNVFDLCQRDLGKRAPCSSVDPSYLFTCFLPSPPFSSDLSRNTNPDAATEGRDCASNHRPGDG